MANYALKICRSGTRAQWVTGLPFAAAVARAAALLEVAERERDGRYLTVTIYASAMVAATFRYYPESLRSKGASLAELDA